MESVLQNLLHPIIDPLSSVEKLKSSGCLCKFVKVFCNPVSSRKFRKLMSFILFLTLILIFYRNIINETKEVLQIKQNEM